MKHHGIENDQVGLDVFSRRKARFISGWREQPSPNRIIRQAQESTSRQNAYWVSRNSSWVTDRFSSPTVASNSIKPIR